MSKARQQNNNLRRKNNSSVTRKVKPKTSIKKRYILSGDQLLVHNLKGTTGRYPQHNDTWTEHYRDGSNRRIAILECSVRGCSNTGNCGGHVQIHGKGTVNTWFIVPLCSTHNHHTNTEPFLLKKDTRMVYVVMS